MLPTTLAKGAFVSRSMKAELEWKKDIQLGDRGAAAKRVQEHLTLNGHPVVIDSDFGPATEKSLRKFQSSKGLAVTGVADRATHEALVDPMVRALHPIAGDGLGLSDLAHRYALQHVAAGAREAGGDNRGPWVRAYLGWDGKEARWCAGFVCYALEQAAHAKGVAPPIKSSASCDTLALQAKQSGRFVPGAQLSAGSRPTKLKPGSFFLVRAAPTDWIHVGIVADADPATFDTVEGNTNDEGSPNGYEATTRVRGYAAKDFIVW